MTPKDLRTQTLSEMAGMVERRITDILVLLEQIVFEADPQNQEAEEDICDLCDFNDTIASAYDKAKSALNELQG